MKQPWSYSWAVISGLCLPFILNGCVSVPNSPVARFYVLQTEYGKQADTKTTDTSDLLISVGPIKIPEYLDRPQMVTQSKEKMLKFAEFDRWGESLDLGIARTIRESLAEILPAAKLTSYPWNPSISVKYQVIVEVIRFDSELNKDLFFVAQWTVIDTHSMKSISIKRSEFRQPVTPQNYSGLAKTLSTVCVSLSKEIAETLAMFDSKSLEKR